MPPHAWTLPQLARGLDTPYRTLQSWVERGLVTPSVHRAAGPGRANLFDAHDAFVVCVLRELRTAGVGFELLEATASKLEAERDQVREPVYLLVNGRVELVQDRGSVTAAVDRDGPTLAYYTAPALQRVQALPA